MSQQQLADADWQGMLSESETEFVAPVRHVREFGASDTDLQLMFVMLWHSDGLSPAATMSHLYGPLCFGAKSFCELPAPRNCI